MGIDDRLPTMCLVVSVVMALDVVGDGSTGSPLASRAGRRQVASCPEPRDTYKSM